MKKIPGLRNLSPTYLVVLAIALSAAAVIACGSSDDPTATAANQPTATATTVAESTATATSEPVTGSASVAVRADSDHGDILVDGDGLTLYIYDRDTEGVSNCAGGCLTAWPPLLTDSDPEVGSGVTADIGTITLADGAMQVTVNGFPAYYWQNDATPGDTLGNAVGSVWWVFNADGTPQRPAKVAIGETDLGDILVDGDGLALYIYDRDTERVSNCAGGCLTAWPPLLTDYPPVAVGDVTAEIDYIELADGTMQVTVNGFPAYYWQNDSAPGDTLGNTVGNVWWVFNPDGTPQRPAKVGLAENAIGDILVDGAGYTLYLFDNDSDGVSNCSGSCLVNWPPLLTDHEPVALSDVTAEIGSITRDDGTTQVTVNGLPVYFWVSDANQGDTDGQGRGGVWWVMGADGSAIRS